MYLFINLLMVVHIIVIHESVYNNIMHLDFIIRNVVSWDCIYTPCSKLVHSNSSSKSKSLYSVMYCVTVILE